MSTAKPLANEARTRHLKTFDTLFCSHEHKLIVRTIIDSKNIENLEFQLKARLLLFRQKNKLRTDSRLLQRKIHFKPYLNSLKSYICRTICKISKYF